MRDLDAKHRTNPLHVLIAGAEQRQHGLALSSEMVASVMHSTAELSGRRTNSSRVNVLPFIVLQVRTAEPVSPTMHKLFNINRLTIILVRPVRRVQFAAPAGSYPPAVANSPLIHQA